MRVTPASVSEGRMYTGKQSGEVWYLDLKTMAPNQQNPVNMEETSFPDYPYPSLRDDIMKDADQWLQGKVLDDGAEGFWRIHNDIYDFSEFINKHPGGADWLEMTKGTDITEAFECHHITTLPERMLSKFHIKPAEKLRNSPFSFEDKGFYRTLKVKVREEIKKFPQNLESKSKRLIECLTLTTVILAIAGCQVPWMGAKIALLCGSGLFLAWTTICAHNFFHQRDNWRMYLFNLSFLSCREWRVTHVLSHHLYTNTLWDFEISSFEPVLQWMPRKSKTIFARFAPIVYSVIIYIFGFDLIMLRRFVRVATNGLKDIRRYEFIPLSLPLIMFLFGGTTLLMSVLSWMVIIHAGSFVFFVIGVNAAHHHPDTFHDGDAPHEDSDWGMHQLHAVMDRTDITGSHFLVLTNFGDHALHHLFPTLDHAYLPLLYPVLFKTCEEFKTELRMTTQLEQLVGQFRQLARNKTNRKPQ